VIRKLRSRPVSITSVEELPLNLFFGCDIFGAMDFKELFEKFAQNGTVAWIGVRPDRRIVPQSVNSVLALESKGLEGDRYQKKGTRQVTLIQGEHLDSIASFLQKPIPPELTRRNIVVRGINLLSLKGKQFEVGEAVLEYTGDCHPCSRMEENLGHGGYNAMRGLGGITARIIKSGKIALNDPVVPVLKQRLEESI
jgi:MOSC domain-containing protein YiiM